MKLRANNDRVIWRTVGVVGTARCAVRAAFSGATVPAAVVRAGTSQRDVPTNQCSGFTMVEIAIALGVIAFALIAIIGVLPSGLQVGRDNREETIINQDARLLLEALRNGARGHTNAVPGDIASFVDMTMTNGVMEPAGPLSGFNFVRFLTQLGTNVAVMRAISGPVATRTTSGSAGDIPGFRYELRSQIYPAFEVGNVDTNLPFVSELTNRTFEVRLLFRWPVKPNGTLAEAANRQVVRTILSGAINTNGFFASQEFWP